MFAALRGNIFDAFTAELYDNDHVRRPLGPTPIHFVMTAKRGGSQPGDGAARLAEAFSIGGR